MTTIMPTQTDRKALTRDRIVEAASRALRRQGYEGVGVADVMKEAGLTHGGFYAHFASREALLAEATERAGHDGSALLAERVARQQAAGAGPFTALVNEYLRDAESLDAEFGCPVAALASEIPRQRGLLGDTARVRVLALIGAVQRTLPGTDAAQAGAIAATLVGSLQLARALGGQDGRNLLAAARQALLERHPGA